MESNKIFAEAEEKANQAILASKLAGIVSDLSLENADLQARLGKAEYRSETLREKVQGLTQQINDLERENHEKAGNIMEQQNMIKALQEAHKRLLKVRKKSNTRAATPEKFTLAVDQIAEKKT